jgi:hypothetical protein
MRDPKRIQRIINLLHAYWVKYPDLRLGQIIGNATPSKTWMGADGKQCAEPGNSYAFEDDKFEEWLRKQLDPLTQIAADARSQEVEKL